MFQISWCCMPYAALRVAWRLPRLAQSVSRAPRPQANRSAVSMACSRRICTASVFFCFSQSPRRDDMQGCVGKAVSPRRRPYATQPKHIFGQDVFKTKGTQPQN